MPTSNLYILMNNSLPPNITQWQMMIMRTRVTAACTVCTLLVFHCVFLSVKLVGESKFSPPPGQLVEKLIDSGVAAIVTVAVLMVVRCHWISSQADSERQ